MAKFLRFALAVVLGLVTDCSGEVGGSGEWHGGTLPALRHRERGPASRAVWFSAVDLLIAYVPAAWLGNALAMRMVPARGDT